MRRSGVLLVATLIAAGCGSYRPIAPLDDAEPAQLDAIVPLVRDGRIRVAPSGKDGERGMAEITHALLAVGVTPAAPGSADTSRTFTVEAHAPTREFREPMHFVLTAGILPDWSSGRREQTWRVLDAAGHAAESRCRTESPYFAGWIGFLGALQPGWKVATGGVGGKEAPDAAYHRLGLEVVRSVWRCRAGGRE